MLASLRTLALFCLLGGLPCIARAQEPTCWNARRPLTWDDFAGTIPRKSRWDAVTHSRMSYNSRQDSNGALTVRIRSYFMSSHSWTRYKKRHADLLRHEQGHFDITELYARKAQQALEAYGAAHMDARPPEWKLVRIYHQERRAMRHCQRRYDRQTRHSRRKAAQLAWEQKIAAALSDLGAYGSDGVPAGR